MLPETREWIEKAEQDAAVAEREIRARKVTAFDAVCFHAQQCAEKYLKALHVERGVPYPRTHDLSQLLSNLSQGDPSLILLDPAARILTDFAVKYRYPGAWATRVEARLALNHARLVRDQIRIRLALPPVRAARKRRPPANRRKAKRRRRR